MIMLEAASRHVYTVHYLAQYVVTMLGLYRLMCPSCIKVHQACCRCFSFQLHTSSWWLW